MKRKLIVVVLSVFLLVGVLAACANDAPAPAQPEPAPAAPGADAAPETDAVEEEPAAPVGETTEIVIWSDFPGAVYEIFTAAGADFTAAFPQYTISVETFPGAERAERISLANQAGTLPTMMFGASFVTIDWAHQGMVVPITEVVAPIAAQLPQATLEATTFVGEHYFFPLFGNPFGLMYNADIFREAGLDEFISADQLTVSSWTFEDFSGVILPALQELMAGEARYPLSFFAGNEQADPHSHNLLRMHGGQVLAGGRIVAHEDPNTVRALDTLVDWVERGFTNADASTKLGPEAQSDFNNQMNAINFGEMMVFQSILAEVERGDYDRFADGEPFDFRMATVPREGGQQTLAVTSLGGLLMNTDEAQIEGGKLFLTWLIDQTDTHLKDLNLLGMPFHTPILDIIVAQGHPLAPLFDEISALQSYVYDVTGGAPGYVETRALFFPALQARLAGGVTSQETFDNYAEAGNAIIEMWTERSVALNP